MSAVRGWVVTVTAPGDPPAQFWYLERAGAMKWARNCRRKGWTATVERHKPYQR